MLAWDQAQPGGHVATIVEQVGLGHGRIEGGGNHWAHALNGRQALAWLFGSEGLVNLVVHLPNAFVQPDQLLIQVLE